MSMFRPWRPDPCFYERLRTGLDAAAEAALVREPLGSLEPGSRVEIVAPDGAADVDGVPGGTRGVFEGVVTLRGLPPRAVVALDDNGELVFVRFKGGTCRLEPERCPGERLDDHAIEFEAASAERVLALAG
jgi:hypothetical protein